jgi:hypothetical protein
MQVGDRCWWIYDGEVLRATIIAIEPVAFDEFRLKIRTDEGSVYGKLGNPFDIYNTDPDRYEIWHDDIALTKEATIAKVKKELDIARITIQMWKESLEDLEYE